MQSEADVIMKNQTSEIYDLKKVKDKFLALQAKFTLKDENEETTSKNRSLLQECGDLKREKAKYKEDIDKHLAEKAKLETQITRLLVENKRGETSLNLLRKSNLENIDSIRDKCADEVKKLEERFAKEKLDLADVINRKENEIVKLRSRLNTAVEEATGEGEVCLCHR